MGSVLPSISDELAELVATAQTGVVRVEARRRFHASGVVWSADGVIVTAHHVVERDDEIRVGLPGGDTVAAQLVGRDPRTDLAVLRAEGSGFATVVRDGGEPRVGHLVMALARPHHTIRATLGVISALDEGWITSAGGRIDRYLQTDITMHPGFSGGALIDSSGRYLGLTTSALLRGAAATVPASTVARVVDALLAHGHVRRGFLGVNAQPVRLAEGVAKELEQDTAVLIVSTAPGSAAERSGLFVGDTIASLAGHATRGLNELLGVLATLQPGEAAPARIVRAGQVVEVSVTIGESQ